MMVKDKCGWDAYKKFFRYYQEEMPKYLSPNTKENKYSTMAKILSKVCNLNLVPFFKWWSWPILDDAVEDTKNLPVWEGIIDELNTAKEECTGGDSCCTTEKPCNEKQGDCDKDSECSGSLTCGSNNCPKTGTFQNDDDCCEESSR